MEYSPDHVQPLCEHCSVIIPIRSIASTIDIKHYVTVAELVTAAKETTCALCAIIQQNWPLAEVRQRFQHDTEAELEATELQFSLCEAVEPAEPALGQDGTVTTRQVGSVTLRGSLLSAKHKFYHEMWLVIATCSNTIQGKPPIWTASTAATSKSEKLALITTWTTSCEENHALCKAVPNVSRILPTRLIDIASTGSQKLSRLVSSQDITTSNRLSDVRYAALSHCWGSDAPLRTIRENLNNLNRAIPGCDGQWHGTPDQIPWTFREAIDICRTIGIHYIWIDSLCIIQDDPEEWRLEAARMKDVYSNAWLTIAASSAASSAEGCFVGHHSSGDDYLQQVTKFNVQAQSREVDEPAPRDDSQTACVPRAEILSVRVYKNELGRRSKYSALSQRGWVLQEQVLSCRILHCTFPEIHWQCTSSYLTEAGVQLHDDHSDKTYLQTIREVEVGDDEEPVFKVLHRAWCQWMEQYTIRKFTFASDRLAALSGMVQQIAEVTGYTHLLGCWEETLCQDLTWLNSSSRECVDKKDVLPEIPSWSWLSRSKCVVLDPWYPSDATENPCQVTDHVILVDKHIVWEGVPLVSRLLYAELLLQGVVMNIRLTTPPEARIYNPPKLNVDDDIRRESLDEPMPWRCVGGFDEPSDDGNYQFPDDTYDCLLMHSMHRLEPNSITGEVFLILEPVSASVMDERMASGKARAFQGPPVPCYRRIGIGHLAADLTHTKSYFADVENMLIRLI
ncbi:HET domain-containing protein [Microdochium nivale]|nr:HET domain-containing protein [Microdochium nivale]